MSKQCAICKNEIDHEFDNRCDDCSDLPITSEEISQGQHELCQARIKWLDKEIQKNN